MLMRYLYMKMSVFSHPSSFLPHLHPNMRIGHHPLLFYMNINKQVILTKWTNSLETLHISPMVSPLFRNRNDDQYNNINSHFINHKLIIDTLSLSAYQHQTMYVKKINDDKLLFVVNNRWMYWKKDTEWPINESILVWLWFFLIWCFVV